MITPDLDTIHHADAMELLRAMGDDSADLITTDPPYFKVKPDWWDWQWDDRNSYVAWIYELALEWQRVLKPNGSLYVFAWPHMAARVEVEIGKLFNVLNSIVWWKTTGNRNWSADKEQARGFLPNTERIIFAEHGTSDNQADEIAGYSEAERLLKKRIFGDYLKSEWDRAGVNFHEITGAIGAYRQHNHGGAASNWSLGYNIPTAEQYAAMYDYLNAHHGNGSTEYLRREYEYLRREYEDLRREYEDLRRPFNITTHDQFTDVWHFWPVHTYEGKHPTEKPIDLMKHIIKTSSKPDALVLDPFCGSGTTCDAARQLGRHYIGCDLDPHWAQYARDRLAQPYTLSMFDALPQATEAGAEQLRMFEEE